MSLRELLVRDKSIIRGRWDVSNSQVVYESDRKSIEIAKEFFEEVLLKEFV